MALMEYTAHASGICICIVLIGLVLCLHWTLATSGLQRQQWSGPGVPWQQCWESGNTAHLRDPEEWMGTFPNAEPGIKQCIFSHTHICSHTHALRALTHLPGVQGKQVTAELGNVTPYIIVPGPWYVHHVCSHTPRVVCVLYLCAWWHIVPSNSTCFLVWPLCSRCKGPGA